MTNANRVAVEEASFVQGCWLSAKELNGSSALWLIGFGLTEGVVFETVLGVCATQVLCDVGSHWVATDRNVAICMSRRTRALIVPHMYEVRADIESSKQFQIPIIEDCAQALDYKRSRPIDSPPVWRAG